MSITVSPTKGSTHAKCGDGKYSTSTATGTCSDHGGVDCTSSWSYGHVKCHGTAPSPAGEAVPSFPATVEASTSSAVAVPTDVATSLPVTGTSSHGIVSVGFILLLVGSLGIWFTRRKRRGAHR